MKELSFKIGGLNCLDEVVVLKREVGPLVGGEHHLAFDLLRGKMTVESPDRHIKPDEIIDTIERTGMQARPWVDEVKDAAQIPKWNRRVRTFLATTSGLLIIIALFVHVSMSGGIASAVTGDGLGIQNQRSHP